MFPLHKFLTFTSITCAKQWLLIEQSINTTNQQGEKYNPMNFLTAAYPVNVGHETLRQQWFNHRIKSQIHFQYFQYFVKIIYTSIKLPLDLFFKSSISKCRGLKFYWYLSKCEFKYLIEVAALQWKLMRTK